MVTHIALFRWKENIPQEEVNKLMSAIKDLKNQINEVVELDCGENFSKWNEGYTHAVVVKTKTREDLDNYRKHPAHIPVAKKVEELENHSIGIDFED